MKKYLILIIMLLVIWAPCNAQIAFNNVKIGAPVGIQVNNYKILNTSEAGETINAGDSVYTTRTFAEKGAANYDAHGGYHSYDAAMSQDGVYLVEVSDTGVSPKYIRAYKWNEANARYENVAATNPAPTSKALSISMSSDGAKIAISFYYSPHLRTYTWSATNNRYEEDAAPDVLPGFCADSAMSSDGLRMVAISNTDPKIVTYAWNAANNRYEVATAVDIQFVGYPVCVNMSNNGDYLIVNGSASTNRLVSYKWNSTSGRYEQTSMPDNVSASTYQTGASISNDGLHSAMATSVGLLSFTWNAANNRYEKDADAIGWFSGMSTSQVSMSGDGTRLCATMQRNDIPAIKTFTWNAANNRYEMDNAPDIITVAKRRSSACMMDDGSRFTAAYSADNLVFDCYIYPAQPKTTTYKMNAMPFAWADADSSLWQLYGIARNSGNTTDNIAVNAMWWFNSTIAAELVTP